jgi:hypothetical protein
VKRPCLDCGTPTPTSRCPTCHRQREQRMYGPAHQAKRRAHTPAVATGQITCRLCGQPIHGRFDLDHRTDWPAHPTCNASSGARGDG